MVTTVKTPAFCGTCGTRLEREDNTETVGFDVFTGERLTNESSRLHCPNPTVTTKGRVFPSTTYTFHPSYEFVDGAWV